MFKDIITDGRVEKIKAGCLLHGDYKMFIKDEIRQDIYLKKRISNGTQTPNLIQVNESNNELRCKTNTIKGYDVVTENDCLDLSFPTSITRRARVTKGKSPCLMESNNNLYSYKDGMVRTVNQIEMERLQGFPDGYTSILSKAKAGSLLGDGWTLPVIEHIFKFINK
jgi:site-specific DNA-cytosine methylase